MPSWDKPRGGGNDGTGPPRPNAVPRDPYVPVSDALRRPPGDTTGDSSAAGKVQKTERTDTGTDARPDRGPGFTDRGRDAEKVTRLESMVKRFEGLFQRQGDLIDSQQKQIDRLSSDLDRQDKTIEKLEATNDRQAKELDRKDAVIDQLKERVSELEGGSSVDTASNVRDRDDKPVTEQPRSWYRKAAEKLPDKDALAFGTTGAAFAEILATNAHQLSGPMEAAIAGGTAFGTAGYTLLKKQIDKHVNKDKGGNNAD